MTPETKSRKLIDMGYTRDRSIQALVVAKGNLELAVEFLLTADSRDCSGEAAAFGLIVNHKRAITRRLADGLADGLGSSSKPGAYYMKNDSVSVIMNMGYSREATEEALIASGGNLEIAIEYLLLVAYHTS
jgi:uncharacterized UBP type Zn finger protein